MSKIKLLLVLTALVMLPASKIQTYTSIPLTYYDFIEVEDGVDIKSYSQVVNKYFEIPSDVRNFFEASGWKIIISNEQLEDVWLQDNYVEVVARAKFTTKEIRLENSTKGLNGITHEMGHFVYWHIQQPELLAEWAAIWPSESVNISAYAQTNPCEGFAEAFAQIITDNTFKERCPDSYEFVSEVLEYFSENH